MGGIVSLSLHAWACAAGRPLHFATFVLRERRSRPRASVDVLSGKEVALPPLPPLGTGRKSSPPPGSSRYKAPLSRSRQSQQSYSHTQLRGAKNSFRRSRAEKYSDQRPSNGLASARILTCRRKRKCLASASLNHTVFPSFVRPLVGAANVHAVFPGQWKYRFRIHPRDFP